MNKFDRSVKRIEKHYVGDDCVQYMINYKDAITVISPEGILFHSKNDSDLYTNKYLEDGRKIQFPYSIIPVHYQKKGLTKITYVNQLFDFNKPYIKIFDGHIYEYFAIKDDNQALLISKKMDYEKHVEYMTYDELLEFVMRNKSNNEKTFYVYLDGSIPDNKENIFPSEEKIYETIRILLNKNIKDFRKYKQNCPTSVVGQYLKDNPLFLDYYESSITNIDFSIMDFNIRIGYNDLLIIRINDNNIKIQCINVYFVRQNRFEVEIYDIPVNKYTLEQLKYVPKIDTPKEPKIPLNLNSGVTKQDIKDAKKMIKSLRK